MKTDKRKKGSFLSIIIRNYLWFSFAVLLALMSIVVVINWMKNFHLIFCWGKKEHLLF